MKLSYQRLKCIRSIVSGALINRADRLKKRELHFAQIIDHSILNHFIHIFFCAYNFVGYSGWLFENERKSIAEYGDAHMIIWNWARKSKPISTDINWFDRWWCTSQKWASSAGLNCYNGNVRPYTLRPDGFYTHKHTWNKMKTGKKIILYVGVSIDWTKTPQRPLAAIKVATARNILWMAVSRVWATDCPNTENKTNRFRIGFGQCRYMVQLCYHRASRPAHTPWNRERIEFLTEVTRQKLMIQKKPSNEMLMFVPRWRNKSRFFMILVLFIKFLRWF